MGVKHEKISEEVKRSIELYGNNPSFLAGIIRLAIKTLELLISKVLLAAVKIAKRVVNVAHEKVMEKEIPVLKEEPEQVVVVQEETHLPKKPEEPMLLSKYPMIMELDVELKRKNEEIFTVEQERGKLKIELSRILSCERICFAFCSYSHAFSWSIRTKRSSSPGCPSVSIQRSYSFISSTVLLP